MNKLPNARSRPYNIWCLMKARCNNSQNHIYKFYGGRGITYDPHWQNFANFWRDMSSGYDDRLELDRKDNSGNYSKENCRWATRKQQTNNTRRNRRIEFGGLVRTLAEWSEHTGIKQSTIRQRIDAYGWSIERALQTGGY